jgi:hypothetical protein
MTLSQICPVQEAKHVCDTEAHRNNREEQIVREWLVRAMDGKERGQHQKD